MATATTLVANHSPTVTTQEKLLASCPCLNVKLHLANVPEDGASLSGKELKLGLAGVSVVRQWTLS